jgi:hypothetical protein
MNAFPIPSLFIERLGWVLVDSLCQLALITFLASTTVRLLRQHSTAPRHGSLLSRVRRIIALPVHISGVSSWTELGIAACGLVAQCVIGVPNWQGSTGPIGNGAASVLLAAQISEVAKPAVPPAGNEQPADTDKAAVAKPALRITGRVLDAETGKPIEQCRMVPTSVYRDDGTDITWQTQYMKEFTDGRYVYETERPWDKTRLRIEADGYRPATTRVVNKGESAELDLKLVREVFAGTVRLPNGQPAVKAQVALASWTNEITVDSSKLLYSGHGAKLRQTVETDEQGRFVMPSEIDPWVVVVAHEAGYAEFSGANQSLARKTTLGQESATDKPAEDTTVIELKPWGRVEGHLLLGDTPVVGAKYWVYQSRTDNVFVRAHYTLQTDDEGRFFVERLPAGPHGICQRYVDNSNGQGSHVLSGMAVRFDIPSGKSVTLELGSPGRTLVGKLTLPEGFPHKIDWSKVTVSASLQAPRFSGRFRGDESQQSWSEFLRTEEGKLYGRDQVAIAADGSFRIESLPAAEYRLSFVADGQAVLDDPKPDGNILVGSHEFSVPALAPSDATKAIDLGTIKLTSSN